MTSNIMSLKDWVNTIKSLSDDKISLLIEKYGYKKFKKNEIVKILGANAEKFLNMD